MSTPLGEGAIVEVSHPGDAVGVIALCAPGRARRGTAVALEATETLRLTQVHFETLASGTPKSSGPWSSCSPTRCTPRSRSRTR